METYIPYLKNIHQLTHTHYNHWSTLNPCSDHWAHTYIHTYIHTYTQPSSFGRGGSNVVAMEMLVMETLVSLQVDSIHQKDLESVCVCVCLCVCMREAAYSHYSSINIITVNTIFSWVWYTCTAVCILCHTMVMWCLVHLRCFPTAHRNGHAKQMCAASNL